MVLKNSDPIEKTNSKLIIKGKTLFTLAILTSGLTFLTVYLTGIYFNRALSTNLYISLSIIALTLFVFLAYGLFRGTYLVGKITVPDISNFESSGFSPKIPSLDMDLGDDGESVLISVVLWIVVTILIILFMVLFEAIFWFSLAILFTTLYWLFLQAFKVVFYKGRKTKGNFRSSMFLAFQYTLLYTGWLFIIAFVVDIFS